jgi:hypothetical protein
MANFTRAFLISESQFTRNMTAAIIIALRASTIPMFRIDPETPLRNSG